MSDYASESGHWYDSVTGEPRYNIVGKNGKERATTLRDARKYGYVPGATTIIGCASRYGLERWKQEQVLMASLTLPRVQGETEKDFIARVWADSKEQAKRAAERGTAIHAAIEEHYRGGMPSEEMEPWVNVVTELIDERFGIPFADWSQEKSFTHPLGYGGKVDLFCDSVVLDFKTKDDVAGAELYDEHFMQLAAYARGLSPKTGWLALEKMRAGIVFIDRKDAIARICEASPEERDRGWRMFCALLEYWKAANLAVSR